MKVAIVTHYFPPEIGAPQARLSDLARLWSGDGHDVHVITGMPNHPTGVVPDRYRRRLRVRERIDGYRVTRCWLYATPNEGVVKKTMGHLSFMVSSALIGPWKLGRPDVVVVSSPTFFSIGSAWLLARLKRARFVVEVRDLWPAIFVELGVLTNPAAIRLLERLELAAYRAADRVVVVSEGFRDHITQRGIPAGKVVTIRNGVDLDRFTPALPVEEHIRRRLGAADGELLVLYIGAHGISQGLRAVVQAAEKLQDAPVHVALVGEGADKAAVVAEIERLGLRNVSTHPGVDRDIVPAVVAAADICLVPLRDVPLFSTFIPSKMFELLAAGKPVIGSVRGEAASILDDAGAVVVPPEDPVALADAVRALLDDQPRRRAMGVEGRRYVEAHFDRRTLAAQYSRMMSEMVAGQ